MLKRGAALAYSVPLTPEQEAKAARDRQVTDQRNAAAKAATETRTAALKACDDEMKEAFQTVRQPCSPPERGRRPRPPLRRPPSDETKAKC
jgi:hypothetical protein